MLLSESIPASPITTPFDNLVVLFSIVIITIASAPTALIHILGMAYVNDLPSPL